MRHYARWLVGALGLGLAMTSPAIAQSSSPIEFGVDALLAHRSSKFELGSFSSTTNQTFFQFPLAQVRAGFFLNDMIELEPALGVSYTSFEGGHSTNANLTIGLPINLQTDRAKVNWYVRPLVGFDHFSNSGNGDNSSGTQVSFGAGLGVRVPIDRRFAGRFEANYTHGNHSGDFESYNQFGLLAGLSFFTR